MFRFIYSFAVVLCFAAAGIAAEIVTNPNDPGSWTFEVQPPAVATVKTDQGALRIDVTTVGAEAFHVQMYQDGKSPVKDHKYIVRFSAKASDVRPIIVLGQLDENPWSLVTAFTSHEIGREWKQYAVELTMTDSRPGKVRLPVMQFGQRTGSVWLRDISVLEAGETPAPAASAASAPNEPASSGEIMSPTPVPSNWRLEEQSTAKGTLKKEEEALRIDITASSAEKSHLRVYQQDKDLVPGQKYVMKFVAKASTPREVGLTVQVDQAPHTIILDSQTIEFATRWQLYELEFVANKAVPKHTRLPVLAIGGQPGTVWIRDVSVIRAASSPQ